MDEHVAGCSECYQVFSETVAFALAEEKEDKDEPVPKPAQVVPLVRRRVFQTIGGLAAAAALVLAVRYTAGRVSGPASTSLVAQLAQAMGPTRFVEPRLTGGFQHGRLVVLRGGDIPQGLDAHSPAVLSAVAHIRERTAGDTSPEALGALAVTYLVSGDAAAAVKALESATAQDPKSAKLQSDLAAAYLVRASRLDEPSDIPKALEAAEKSVEQKDAPVEAWFNRALALERLHLVDAARKAWDDYLQRDPNSPWAAEARKRKEELPPAQQSTLEEDRAKARSALAEGKPAVDRLADEDPSILRDYFDNVLLYEWADAYLAGKSEAAALKAHAELASDALHRTTGDAMTHDAAAALSLATSGSSRDPPRAQALGYTYLQEAQRLVDAQKDSCDKLKESRETLDKGGSPYALWARERFIRNCLLSARPAEALAELERLQPLAQSGDYTALVARVHWLTAHAFSDRGDFELALEHYQQAKALYSKIRDAEGEASMLGRCAWVLQGAGDSRAAWRERSQGLGLLDRMRDPARSGDLLLDVSNACRQQRLTRCAVQMQSAVVETDRRLANPATLADSLSWRAIYYSSEQPKQAMADLEEARAQLPRIGNVAQADYLAALVDATQARILAASEPESAIALLKKPMAYFEHSRSSFMPELRLTRARSLLALGRIDEAVGDLEVGIRWLEGQRAGFKNAALQASVFDEGASLFAEMVSVQLGKRHDPERALYFVERSRGRQLSESVSSLRRKGSRAVRATTRNAPLTPEAIRRELPVGVALVYYTVEPGQLVSWVVTHDGSQVWQLPLPSQKLERDVVSYQASIDGAANLTALREKSAVVFDELVKPLLPALQAQQALLFIVDPLLQSVPYASLWNRQTGRYLLEDYVLGTAPSGTVFVTAAAAAAGARGRPTKLLAVGNPRLDRSSKLPDLPRAEVEATAVARLYGQAQLLTAEAATRAAFLSRLSASEVVHFAGHATPGGEAGGGALLFAPDPHTRTGGFLYSGDINGSDLRLTRVVVLAGCRTGTGAASRLEGSLSLARPFLAAGVPSVVTSLHDVDDEMSRDFSLAFHHALIATGDPAQAVREAQLGLLRSGDAVRAHPSTWAGFVNVGGFKPPGALREARFK